MTWVVWTALTDETVVERWVVVVDTSPVALAITHSVGTLNVTVFEK